MTDNQTKSPFQIFNSLPRHFIGFLFVYGCINGVMILGFADKYFDDGRFGLNFFILFFDGAFQVEDLRALAVYLFSELHHASL